MGSNLIGLVAWVVLGLIGLFSTVDLGFGPIVICHQCGGGLNTALGIVLIAISAAAFITNRKAVIQR